MVAQALRGDGVGAAGLAFPTVRAALAQDGARGSLCPPARPGSGADESPEKLQKPDEHRQKPDEHRQEPDAPRQEPNAPAKSSQEKVTITSAACVPANNCSANQHEVSTRGRLLLKGQGLRSGMLIAFPQTSGGPITSRSPTGHLHATDLGLVVDVPTSAHSGSIVALMPHGRHSGSFGPVTVVNHTLHPPVKPKPKPAAATKAAPATTTAASATQANGSAFEGDGMWIWYLSKSDGGDLAAIVAQAKAAGIGTLYIKSSDGTNYWTQFSSELVHELHASGLKVCAWQYVYGASPLVEAGLGAEAVQNGADCLVIDAEAQYEGHYAAAQSYLKALRAKIGLQYPLGLASFPYVNYHPSFPYSVFLGPEGAQFNLPQMYWKDIGTTVAEVFVNTYEQNLIYGRPIFPLGQTFEKPSATELVNFRSLATAYGAKGTSWWDWQETASSGWSALQKPLNTALHVPTPELTSPLLKQGAKGDQVLWLQEHLATAIPTQATTGIFDAQTKLNLEQFQAMHGLPQTGQTEPETWTDLLALAPVSVEWTGGQATAARAKGRAPVRVATAPLSARLRPVRGETARRP